MSKPVESFSDYVDNVLKEFRTMSSIGRQSGSTNVGPNANVDVAQLMDDEDIGDPAVANAFKAGDKTQLMRMLITKRRNQLKTVDAKADALRKITQLAV